MIIESNKITDILNHVDDETLVLLDVDNTLIEPASTVGGVVWYDYYLEKLVKQGVDETEAILRLYKLWLPLQYVISIKTVEAETASVIKMLHDQGIKTMGLTARGFLLAQKTDEQLKSVDISLDNNTICDDEITFSEHTGFYKGVLSIKPSENKGKRLVEFFEKIGYVPKKALFVDDKKFFLEEVRDVFAGFDAPLTTIRYGGADKSFTTFDPARADEELKTFFAGTEHEAFVTEMFG